MSEMILSCPHCSQRLKVKGKPSGPSLRCPVCRKMFDLPEGALPDFGSARTTGQVTPQPGPGTSPPGAVPHEDIDQLWKKARSLGWSDAEQQTAAELYTRLLGLIDEQSTRYNICAVLRNRAIAYRSMKNYDAALADLGRELEIARRRGDQMRVLECESTTHETLEWKRKAEIQASGGDKAARIKSMEELARKLWGTGHDADTAFETLFGALQDPDPDVRAEASSLLADALHALRKLIAIYQESLRSNPRRASLAGRVLGRKLAKGSHDVMPSQVTRMMYGISASFIPCPCVHCGHMNTGIPAPPNGPMVPYYHQADDKGAYAVPVICDKCGTEFFVVWDSVPG